MYIEIVMIFAGVYLIVNSVKMKKEGVIPPALINSKIKQERAKDVPGYIAYMYPKNIVFGGIFALFGAILLFAEFKDINDYIFLVALVVFLAAIIAYAVITSKAINKYLF